MIVGLNIFDQWVLYDNSKLPYDNFNPNNADFRGDFTILLIGYVNIAQEGMFINHFIILKTVLELKL